LSTFTLDYIGSIAMKSILRGIGIYPAVCIGKTFILKRYTIRNLITEAMRRKITVEDFKEAIKETRKELENLINFFPKEKEELLKIIEFQLMLLEDESFIGKIYDLINKGSHPIEALKETIDEIKSIFSGTNSIYLQERVNDVIDLCIRVLKNLLSLKENEIKSGSIIVSEELYPSEVVMLSGKVSGIITVRGTALSHFAIMAREFGIPTVVNVHRALDYIKGNEKVIVNALSGIVIVNPSKDVELKYKKIKSNWDRTFKLIVKQATKPAYTKDGVRIFVVANLGRIDEVETAAYYGAEGIGLFRTEFLFLGRDSPPSEDEQFNAFKLVVQRLSPRNVFIRTLDIGSDKQIPYIFMHREVNPALGKRGIRLYWKEIRDIILTQVKAILRAAVYGSIGIMFPMVSDVSEIIKGRNLVGLAADELRNEEKKFGNVKIGIMIETPSAVMLADEFAKYVDFMSIGTNDLTQYTLAVDRTGIKTPTFFDHIHPSVLRLVKHAVDVVKNMKVELSICGESASDIYAIPILIGLGIRKISVSPLLIPIVKHVVRLFNINELEELANEALKNSSSQEIRELVKEFYVKKQISLPIF